MLPAVVLVQAEIDLNERPPFGPFRFANQMHARLLRRAIGLAGITLDTGADDIFPGGRPAPIARDDMIQVEVFAVETFAAILAGALVALENVMPGELDLFLGEMIVNDQQNHSRHPDPEGNRSHRFGVRFLLRKAMPFAEIIGLKRAVVAVQNNVGVALEKQSQSATRGADIDGLPETIQHEHVLVEHRTHIHSNWAKATQMDCLCQRGGL